MTVVSFEPLSFRTSSVMVFNTNLIKAVIKLEDNLLHIITYSDKNHIVKNNDLMFKKLINCGEYIQVHDCFINMRLVESYEVNFYNGKGIHTFDICGRDYRISLDNDKEISDIYLYYNEK